MGTVRIEVSIEVPVQTIVTRWTQAERATLTAEKPEAQDELVEQAFDQRAVWSRFEVERWEVKLDGWALPHRSRIRRGVPRVLRRTSSPTRARGGWACEQHPALLWPYDECPGVGNAGL